MSPMVPWWSSRSRAPAVQNNIGKTGRPCRSSQACHGPIKTAIVTLIMMSDATIKGGISSHCIVTERSLCWR
eukprot:37930-Eustigmatos_ZCMA.PRE.1